MEPPPLAMLDQPQHPHLDPEPTPTCLLDLPHHLIVEILSCCQDVYDVCAAGRTCTVLLQLSGTPMLWPHFQTGGPLTSTARRLLSVALHLPPQIFSVQLEPSRSRKFPINVPLHNLRLVLGFTDPVAAAEALSTRLQDWLSRLRPHERALWPGQPPPPACAAFACMRADRGAVRMELAPAVAVPIMLMHALSFTPAPLPDMAHRHAISFTPAPLPDTHGMELAPAVAVLSGHASSFPPALPSDPLSQECDLSVGERAPAPAMPQASEHLPCDPQASGGSTPSPQQQQEGQQHEDADSAALGVGPPAGTPHGAAAPHGSRDSHDHVAGDVRGSRSDVQGSHVSLESEMCEDGQQQALAELKDGHAKVVLSRLHHIALSGLTHPPSPRRHAPPCPFTSPPRHPAPPHPFTSPPGPRPTAAFSSPPPLPQPGPATMGPSHRPTTPGTAHAPPTLLPGAPHLSPSAIQTAPGSAQLSPRLVGLVERVVASDLEGDWASRGGRLVTVPVGQLAGVAMRLAAVVMMRPMAWHEGEPAMLRATARAQLATVTTCTRLVAAAASLQALVAAVLSNAPHNTPTNPTNTHGSMTIPPAASTTLASPNLPSSSLGLNASSPTATPLDHRAGTTLDLVALSKAATQDEAILGCTLLESFPSALQGVAKAAAAPYLGHLGSGGGPWSAAGMAQSTTSSSRGAPAVANPGMGEVGKAGPSQVDGAGLPHLPHASHAVRLSLNQLLSRHGMQAWQGSSRRPGVQPDGAWNGAHGQADAAAGGPGVTAEATPGADRAVTGSVESVGLVGALPSGVDARVASQLMGQLQQLLTAAAGCVAVPSRSRSFAWLSGGGGRETEQEVVARLARAAALARGRVGYTHNLLCWGLRMLERWWRQPQVGPGREQQLA